MILGIALPTTASADHNMSLLVQGGAGGSGPMNLNICLVSSGCDDDVKSPEGGVLQLGGGYTYTYKYLRVSTRLEGALVFGEGGNIGGFTWAVGNVGLHTRWVFAEAGGGMGEESTKAADSRPSLHCGCGRISASAWTVAAC